MSGARFGDYGDSCSARSYAELFYAVTFLDYIYFTDSGFLYVVEWPADPDPDRDDVGFIGGALCLGFVCSSFYVLHLPVFGNL